MKILLFLLLVRLSVSEVPHNHFYEARSNDKPIHECIHDQLEAWKRERGYVEHVEYTRPDHVEVPYEPKKRNTNQQNLPTFRPIRIYIATDHLTGDPYTCYSQGQEIQAMQGSGVITYTCTSQDVLTQTKINYLLNTLLPTSIGWLESALNVIPVIGNLQLNSASCTSTPLDVSVPSSYANPGVDADFIIFITSRPIMGGATLAFASTCAVDNTGRPIAGQANFNTSNLYGEAEDLPQQSGVATHELCHALGFSSTRWEYGTFIQYTGGKDSSGNWLYSKIPATSTYAITGAAASPHETLITPTVVETVRNYFGCSSIVGGDMEDGGGSGTVNSHWEKRIFMNEYMTGSLVNNPILSNFTLALFADTGWYTVNYNVTEVLLWGRGLGCDFVEKDCSNWTVIAPSLPGFCDEVSQTVSCAYTRLGYGICNLVNTYTNIPTYYRHYDGDSPSIGGQSLLADYCGYVGQEGITTFCNTGSGSSVQQDSDFTSFFGLSTTGEQFGKESRCLLSTLNHLNVGFEIDAFTNLIIPSIQSCRCYNHSCVSPTDLRIQVSGIWYPCDQSEIQVFGYGGSLTCPQPEELCQNAPVDKTWPILYSISPAIGPPSTVITLTGANFNTTSFNYSVIVEDSYCSDVRVIDNTTIVATIPGGSYFVSVADLSLFNTKLDVIVIDSRGYTDQLGDSFTIQVVFDAEYLMNLFNWMGSNPLWAFVIWACILIPLFCICCCIYKCCKRRKKPNPKSHHEYAREREYYDDDFEVDDHYEKAK